jgi:large subunit ribosomal protein L5
MWEFLDRTVNAALPRIRDFRGIPPEAFDGRGNYSLGIREQLIFPEIEYDKVDRVRGLQINIITTAKNDEEGRRLLELVGFPFPKRTGARDGEEGAG